MWIQWVIETIVAINGGLNWLSASVQDLAETEIMNHLPYSMSIIFMSLYYLTAYSPSYYFWLLNRHACIIGNLVTGPRKMHTTSAVYLTVMPTYKAHIMIRLCRKKMSLKSTAVISTQTTKSRFAAIMNCATEFPECTSNARRGSPKILCHLFKLVDENSSFCNDFCSNRTKHLTWPSHCIITEAHGAGWSLNFIWRM